MQVAEPQWAPPGAVPRQYQPAVPSAPVAARNRWTRPLLILCVVLGGALVLFGVGTALVRAGVSAVNDARHGGSGQFRQGQFGQTFINNSGLGLTVSTPRTAYVDDESIVGPDEQAYEVVVTVVNGTTNPIASFRITLAATVDGVAVDPIHLDGPTTQDIAPGQRLTVPFRFKVQDGVVGPIQIAVQDADNDAVVFTGSH